MSVTLKPVTLLLAALAVAGAASGVTVLVMRNTTPCPVVAAPAAAAPAATPTDAEREAATRRALERKGSAATGGRSF